MAKYEDDIQNLKQAIRSYEKLFKKAVRVVDPTDTVSIQRLASGISALSKAHSVIDKQKPYKRTLDVLE